MRTSNLIIHLNANKYEKKARSALKILGISCFHCTVRSAMNGCEERVERLLFLLVEKAFKQDYLFLK